MPRSGEPDYKGPFCKEDFRGYFKWSKALTRKLNRPLYHACHRGELLDILDDEALGLRSEWSLELPAHGLYSVPGAWTGLNCFYNGNNYGPFLIKFSLSVLNHRSFMVFQRKGSDRKRYFFVQYEALIPVYSFKKNLWRRMRPAAYFLKNDDSSLGLRPGAIYDIVVTEPISISEATFEGVEHPYCIPGKCSGSTLRKNNLELARIARRHIKTLLAETRFYRNILQQFSILEGQDITLPGIE